jgi:hypothetical protein
MNRPLALLTLSLGLLPMAAAQATPSMPHALRTAPGVSTDVAYRIVCDRYGERCRRVWFESTLERQERLQELERQRAIAADRAHARWVQEQKARGGPLVSRPPTPRGGQVPERQGGQER